MERLKSHRDFTTVLRRRSRVSSHDLVIHFLVSDPVSADSSSFMGSSEEHESFPDSRHRLGLAVSKRVGKAVLRNKVKRRFRQLARDKEDLLPPYCDLVIRAKPGVVHCSYQDLDRQMDRLFRDMHCRVDSSKECTGAKPARVSGKGCEL